MLVRSAVSRSNQSLQRTFRDLASVDSRSSQWESVSISNAKFQRESIISRKTSLTFKSFCLGFSIAILSNNDTSVSWCPQKVGFSIWKGFSFPNRWIDLAYRTLEHITATRRRNPRRHFGHLFPPCRKSIEGQRVWNLHGRGISHPLQFHIHSCRWAHRGVLLSTFGLIAERVCGVQSLEGCNGAVKRWLIKSRNKT